MKIYFRCSFFKIISPLLFIVITLLSCESNEAKNEKLRLETQEILANDVRTISHAAIDNYTMGIGSIFLNATMSKQKQDSILLSPLLPYIKKELKLKSNEELEEINSNSSSRMLFIGNCIYNNKVVIIETISHTYSGADKLIESVIELIENEK
mgnify:FL=1